MRIPVYVFVFFLLLPLFAFAQSEAAPDSTGISHKRKEKKEDRKTARIAARKQLNKHFYLILDGIYADVNSQVRFEDPDGLLSAQVNFERHLGLQDRKMLYVGRFVYRATPRSGLFASYYRLYRQNSYELENDIVFLGDTLKKGLLAQGFFNTDVFSIGYLLSILKEENAFFGAYFNLFLINVQAGVRSEVFDFDESTGLLAPLPNFGLVAMFKLKNWVSLAGGVGIFFLNMQGLNGNFLDVNASVTFTPVRWLGINVGYYLFDVNAGWPVEQFRAYANYNYSGPSFGLTFSF